jgi:hypothetical protein
MQHAFAQPLDVGIVAQTDGLGFVSSQCLLTGVQF